MGGREGDERERLVDVVDEDDLGELESRGGRRRFKRGATLMHEGAPGAEVMLVIEGRVKISVTTADGREIVLGFQGPGDLIGELAAIDGRPRSGTTEALEPVEVLAISAADFNALLDRPSFSRALLRTLVSRFRDADRRRVEFAASQTLGRVAARLAELARRHGTPVSDGVEITLPISQEELAGWTGSSREAVAKALRTLRSLGTIRTERRKIVVLDAAALERQSA